MTFAEQDFQTPEEWVEELIRNIDTDERRLN